MKEKEHRPSSETPDTARHRALSAASRVRMLDLARRADEGMTAAQMAAATGLHLSTVRAHLDQLVESGLLTRRRHGDGSPGRPAWRYRTAGTPDSEKTPHADGAYQALAAALVGHIARDAADPHAAGVRAGRDWGRALAASLASPAKATTPVDGMIRVMDRLGFTPRVVHHPDPGSTVVHLRSCPFLDLALANPDVVCGVHHGVMGGALGALGASAAAADLKPFAAPGACVIQVQTHGAASTGQAITAETSVSGAQGKQ